MLDRGGGTIMKRACGGHFRRQGRHLRTVHSLTGAAHHRFVYDAAARLVGVEDGYRNTTRIERDAGGVPAAIVAPGGQRTALAIAREVI
jgi:YD repeat-containing protein